MGSVMGSPLPKPTRTAQAMPRRMAQATRTTTARRTMAVVRQNFALAIGYNLLAVPLAIAARCTCSRAGFTSRFERRSAA